MAGYLVTLRDGTVVAIAEAARAEKNGSGTYLYDADGKQIASFGDGEARSAIPADSAVTPPPAAPEEPAP